MKQKKDKKNGQYQRTEPALAVLSAFLCGLGLFYVQNTYLTSHIWIAVMWAVGAFWMTLIGWRDFREYRIPNILVLLLLGTQLLCLLIDWSGLGTEVFRGLIPEILAGQNWLDRMLGLVIPGLLILGLTWRYPGGMGAGDGKVFLVLGFTLGFDVVIRVMFWSVLLLAIVSLYAIWKEKADRKTVYPLGPAIWAAYLIVGCMG